MVVLIFQSKMESIISLQSGCLLTIIANIHHYSADLILLIPPKLRARFLQYVPVVDVYRLARCPSVWYGLSFSSEDVWRLRFETTLQKYTNVSCLEEMSGLSWSDRYLASCLINVPVYYQTVAGSNHPPFGAAFFVTSDISLSEVTTLKLKSGMSIHGLNALKSKGKTDSSSRFISSYYQQKTLAYPYNSPIGTRRMTTCERIKHVLDIFPNWQPSLIPLEYDDQSGLTQQFMNRSQCESFIHNVNTVYLSSKYLRYCSHAEIEDSQDSDEVFTSGQFSVGPFCSLMMGLISGRGQPSQQQCVSIDGTTSQQFIRLFLSQTPVRKEVQYDYDQETEEVRSSFRLIPLYNTSTIIQWFHQQFPSNTVSSISVSMHNGNQDCWDCPVFQAAKDISSSLNSLQLKVVRPTFSEIVRPLLPFAQLKNITLNGLAIQDRNFYDILLNILKSPHEQNLKLSNIEIKAQPNISQSGASPQGMKDKVIPEQVMAVECRSKTSLLFHRIKGIHHVDTVFSAFTEVWLNDLSFYIVDESPPFSKSTIIHCKCVHAERFTLDQNGLDLLAPVFINAGEVYLSVGQCGFPSANLAIPKINQCVQICEANLVYLDCRHAIPYSGLQIEHVKSFFQTVVSLPSHILANLVFDPSQLIDCYGSAMATRRMGGNILAHLHQQTRRQAELDELNHRLRCWSELCRVWESSREEPVKFKCFAGVHELIVDMLDEDLSKICNELNYR